MAQTRTLLASGAGVLAESMDWISFFVVTTLAAAPALVLLWWLSRRTGGPVRVAAEAG